MASHSYLGDKLEAIRSRVFLKEGNEYELLIIPLRNIILFPGDTLPLRLRNRSYIKAVEGLLKGTSTNYLGGMNSVHLGIVNLTDDDEPITSGTVGTTSEVRGHRSQLLSDNRLTGEPDEMEEMIVTAKVCQRFRLLEDPRRVNGVKVARVLILSESNPNFNSVDASKSPFPSWVSTGHQRAFTAFQLFYGTNL
jgi:Lon protease-like protein